jgi:hypothetical protein
MKTAVEWLEEKLIDIFNFKKGECFEIEQAKEMEKQQMIEMHDKGFDFAMKEIVEPQKNKI